MSDSLPIACSLEADDLRQRLVKIAALGERSLYGRNAEGDSRVVRFRRDPETRRELSTIVAAEARCCGFLDLDLSDDGDALVLRIAAAEDGASVADELALAFGEPR